MTSSYDTPSFPYLDQLIPRLEQPLHAYESCNLGSINLSNFYDPAKKDRFDWTRFAQTISRAVRFLDNGIEVNNYPLPQIEDTTKGNRRIGLGIMGWADLLIKKEMKYDTNPALKFAEKVASFLRNKAEEESMKLAEIRGSFPNMTLAKGECAIAMAAVRWCDSLPPD